MTPPLKPDLWWWSAWPALAAACFVATLALSGLSSVREVNDRLNDGLFRIRNESAATSPITVVVIDDISLAREGRWPWSRAILANLITATAAQKPRAIGLDILLSEPSDPKDDVLLAKAIARAGNVVLPEKLSSASTGPSWVEPLPLFAQRAAGVGHVQAILDGDGVCRRLPVAEMSLHGPVLMMATVLVQASLGIRKVTAEDKTLQSLRPASRTIDYRGLAAGSGNSKPFQTISADVVLHGNSQSLSGRIVLIGFAGSGLEDELLTPLDYAAPAAGVLIQANMADTLSRSRYIRRASLFIQILILMGLCMLGSLALRSHRGWKTTAWLVASTLITYSVAYATFVHWGTQFDLGLGLLAELLIVPLAQLQHLLTLQALIGSRLTSLQLQTQDLALATAGLLKVQSGARTRPHGSTNAEWKLGVIAGIEEQLTLVSAFQQTLLQTMRDGIAVFASDGRLLFHNAAWTDFLDQARWNQHSCWPQLLFALRPATPAPLGLPAGAEVQEVQIPCESGKEVLIGDHLWHLSLLKLPAFLWNEQGFYMALSANLTAQMERDQARQEALQFITHELRTPLVSLQGFAELLQRFPDQAEAAGAAEVIQRESERLVALTTMYLECLRLETTLPVVSPIAVDAGALMKQAALLAQPLCAASNKLLVVAASEHPIPLYVDADMITSSVLNLIANALKYGTTDTNVHARVEAQGENAILSIRNHGPQIPQDEISRLFTSQYRMPRTARTQIGWGVGLAFVKKVAEAHGGAVHVSSDLTDTCFWLSIPIATHSTGGRG